MKSRTKFPWLALRKKTDPELPLEPPLWLHDHSNGEAYHFQTPYERKLRHFIMQSSDDNARKLGMDRREFLASTMGMATALWCVGYASGCASEEGGAGGAGGLCVPREAMFDEQAACTVISGDEFIFDVQTHWFNTEDMTRFPDSVRPIFLALGAANQEAYVNGMFLQSDTDVAVLTSWPGTYCSEDPANTDPCGLPLSNESMWKSRDTINELACNTQRVIQHFQLLPTDQASIDVQKELMTRLHCEQKVHGWKMYPGFNPSSIDPSARRGYFLTDETARALIEHGLALGVNRFSVHKGLAIGSFFEAEHNHPRDVGPAAKDYPQARFIIYHSGICSGFQDANGNSICDPQYVEGPYDENEADPKGVNAFIRSLKDAGIGPDQNVYAEVGSAIDRVMTNDIAAQHFFGKLMLHVGVNRVVWGTDCMATRPSPREYIEWFRALTISDQLQEQYGYPPLDATNKAKIFGRNAAELYGIDVEARRCQIDTCSLTLLRRQLDEEFGPRRSVFQRPGGPSSWREYVEQSRRATLLGRPG